MNCRDGKVLTNFLGRAALFLTACVLGFSGCGYRIRSSVGTLPSEAQSLGIPTFRNSTTQYKIEQLISRAVLREFSTRTRATVNSSSSGVDLVLLGDIRELNSVPVIFGSQPDLSQTTASAFRVTVHMNVRLMRLKDSSTLWRNDDFVYSETYTLNSNVRDFFLEENPALERLAQNFAASLASTVLTRSKP